MVIEPGGPINQATDVDARCMQGLRVLLVDDEPSRSFVEAQLQQPDLAYSGKSRAQVEFCQLRNSLLQLNPPRCTPSLCSYQLWKCS